MRCSAVYSLWTPALNDPTDVYLLRVVGDEWTNLEDCAAVIAIGTKKNTRLRHPGFQRCEDVCNRGMVELLLEDAKFIGVGVFTRC